jgi:phosphate/sulfate permease
VVVVVGGSGVTFALSVVQDLIQKDLEGKSKVKVIDVVWTVQDPGIIALIFFLATARTDLLSLLASLVPLLPLFMSMIQQSIFTPVRISVHYTRAPLEKDSFRPQPGLSLSPGRPRITKVLDAAISRAVSLGAGAKDSERITGLLVAVCGPVGLGDEVVKAVGSVAPSRRDQVGGIEMHEECVFSVLLIPYALAYSVLIGCLTCRLFPVDIVM